MKVCLDHGIIPEIWVSTFNLLTLQFSITHVYSYHHWCTNAVILGKQE